MWQPQSWSGALHTFAKQGSNDRPVVEVGVVLHRHDGVVQVRIAVGVGALLQEAHNDPAHGGLDSHIKELCLLLVVHLPVGSG